MAEGPDEPDDGGRPEEGPVLSPEELDIADDEHVTKLDEGRFVVSPEVRNPGRTERSAETAGRSDEAAEDVGRAPRDGTGPGADPGGTPGAGGGARDGEIGRDTVHRWLRESFEDGGSRYGFDITATFNDRVNQRRLASNDVVTIFESLLVWYAQQIDNDTPVEEILGLLLMEANVPVKYPPESLKQLVKSAGLGPDDTVADLLVAVKEDDGVEL